jgi:hypothetical protein
MFFVGEPVSTAPEHALQPFPAKVNRKASSPQPEMAVAL